MYNNDYIIAVDENGQPYISHAFGDGIKKKWGELTGRATKYLQKIRRPDGTYRYVYDTAKKVGKKAWGSKAGRWIDEHDAGISERLMARRASRKAKQSAKRGDHDAAKYYARRSRELNQESAAERNRAKRTLAAAPKRAWGSKAGRFIDEHDAGVSEWLMANYYRRKGRQADKSGNHKQAEEYRARAMSLYREGKDEGAATRERLKKLTTRKKKQK